MPSAVTLWLFLGTSTSQQCSLLDGAVPCRLSRPDSLPAEELVSGPREKPRPPASLSQHASDPTTLHPQADCLQPWTLTLPALFHLLHLPGPGSFYPLPNGATLVTRMVKNLPAMQETKVQSLGQEDPHEGGNGNPL